MLLAEIDLIPSRMGRKLLLAGDQIFRATGEEGGSEEEGKKEEIMTYVLA